MAGALQRAGHLINRPLLISIKGWRHSEVGYPLKVPLPIQAKEISRADLVMYTHADDDHFGTQTAKALAARTRCRFLAPDPVYQRLKELGIQQERLIKAIDGAAIQQDGIEVQVTPALHDWQEVNPWKRGDCCGYIIRSQAGAIWHPGDTRLIDELLSVKESMSYSSMYAVESHLGPGVGAYKSVQKLIAYHYGTFDLPPGSFANCDPDEAIPYLQDIDAQFLKLQPGEVFTLDFQ
jgi:hypothetical protein